MFFLRPIYHWSIWPKCSSFVSSLHRTLYQSFCGFSRLIWAYWRRHFLWCDFSCGVCLEVLNSEWRVRRTVSTETQVPLSVKLSFRYLAVILRFLSTCLLRNLAVIADNFFFRPRPCYALIFNLHALMFKFRQRIKLSLINDLSGEMTIVTFDECIAGSKYISDFPPPVPAIVKTFSGTIVEIIFSCCRGRNDV